MFPFVTSDEPRHQISPCRRTIPGCRPGSCVRASVKICDRHPASALCGLPFLFLLCGIVAALRLLAVGRAVMSCVHACSVVLSSMKICVLGDLSSTRVRCSSPGHALSSRRPATASARPPLPDSLEASIEAGHILEHGRLQPLAAGAVIPDTDHSLVQEEWRDLSICA